LNRKINTLYFSATGTTKKVVTEVANRVANDFKTTVKENDFTLPGAREKHCLLLTKMLLL